MGRKPKNSTLEKNVEKSLHPKKVGKISEDKYFVLCNGEKIADYIQLAEMLEVMPDDIFYYHVADQRNDFANWIHDVFEEQALSDQIKNVKNRYEMCMLIYKHLYHKRK